MRLRSLETRIVGLFLLLILIVQLAGLWMIRAGIEKNVRAAASAQLAIGERTFKNLLQQGAKNLEQAARLLAADHDFQQAASNEDYEAIGAALFNYRGRSGATLTALVGADHRLRASNGDQSLPNLDQAILQLVDGAEQAGKATGIVLLANRVFRVEVVPVMAPITIGWVAMAQPIDQALIADMRELMPLEVSILTRANGGQWQAGMSTLSQPDLDKLSVELQAASGAALSPAELQLHGDELATRIFRLAQDPSQTAIVVLHDSIDQAMAPYRGLLLALLALTAVGIALAVIGSALIARRITGPLRQLAEGAKRLGGGDYYQGLIGIKREDEIGELSRAFDTMREGIANRELEIRRLAYWDNLTNLPNRTQFVALLDGALTQARKDHLSCHVLMMDLDRFKHVNDVLGHTFGDALLQQVAHRLSSLKIKSADHIARLGGDEFAVLLADSSLGEAQEIASRILKSLETPISLDDQTIDLGASIGIAGFPAHGNDAESLLSRAEVAMYAAKTGGNEAVVYDAAIDKSSQESLSLLGELRHAIDNGEFRLHVQPKILLPSRKVIGVEVLVRWMHPKRGLLQPDQFIPFAEKTGFIRNLTRWVLEQAAALYSRWETAGVHLKISVNLSTRDLLDQDLPTKFMEILVRHQVASSCFCLEITESAIMDDPVRAQQTLERLYAMGIELSIDDFGTGYSSLSYLKRLPVHELKIDKSFVMNMKHETDDATIVRSTIDLGHNMGLRVVAEGIESDTALQLLARMGCDQGQGYFISRPMPADQFLGWLKRSVPPQAIVYENLI
ncbi:MAG TPA: EAL domain-containing protein [Burkholderiaceae bacterium]|nr:EAL domain-containing protein [Burkholderiaceae bacterium]